MKLQILLLVSFACILAVRADETPEAKPEAAVKTEEAAHEHKSDKCECTDDTCKCSHEGHAHSESHKTSETVSDQADTCTPGEMFNKECNECKCPDSGRKSEAACTIMACP